MSFSNPEGTGICDVFCKNHILTVGFYRVSKYYHFVLQNVIKHIPISKKEIIKYVRGTVFLLHNVGPVLYCDVISVHDSKVFFFTIVNRTGRHIIRYYNRNILRHDNDYCYENKCSWNVWQMTTYNGINYKDIILSDKLVLADLETVFKIYSMRNLDIEDVKNKTIEYLMDIYNTYSNALLLNVYLAINCDMYRISYDKYLLKEVSFNNEDMYKTYIFNTLSDRQDLYLKLVKKISGHKFLL